MNLDFATRLFQGNPAGRAQPTPKPSPRLARWIGAVLGVSGATATAELTPVHFQLDWIYNAQFAGLYQGIEQGYFAEAGLEVTLVETQKSIGVVEAVVAQPGIAFGSSEGNVLLGARQQGQPVVALAAMFQGSPMGWMSLAETGVTSVADFTGKRVGIHADGTKVLAVALAQENLNFNNVVMTEVGYDPQILLDGSVDLMQAYYLDEFVALQKLAPTPPNFLFAKDNGYESYSQVLFTTEATLKDHPEIAAAMLEACRRGWQYALDHPGETIDLILARWNPGLDRDYQLSSLQKIAELVRPDGTTIMPLMSIEAWARSQAVFLQYGILEGPVDLANFVYQP